MKKKWLAWIISVSVLLGVGLGAGIYAICDACSGDEAVPEFVAASAETVYITDFKYTYEPTDGTRSFSYRFVNNSDEELHGPTGYPALERRSGNTWLRLENGIVEGGATYPARRGVKRGYSLEEITRRVSAYAEEGFLESDDVVGEYRLVYCFDTFDVSVTFSITQEMLP